jgi:uncharacterized membrane protein
VTRELTRFEPIGVALLTSLASTLVLVDVHSPVRSVLVAAFVLVCPGLALVRLLRLEEPLFELTLGIALSLALAGLVSVALLYAHAWSPGKGLAILAVIAFGGSAFELATEPSERRAA